MNSILLLLIGSLIFLLLLAIGVLVYYRRLNKEAETEGETQGDTTTSGVALSEAYLRKLEKTLQIAFENAARNATASLEEEFKNTLSELSQQNDSLVSAVKDLEDKYIGEFQSSLAQIQDSLADNISSAAKDINVKNQEMVQMVEALENKSKNRIEEALSGVVQNIQEELSGTGAGLKEHVQEVVINAIRGEVDSFKSTIDAAREETVNSLTQIYKDTETKKRELEEQMRQEVQARREKLLSQLDHNINNVIVQFLIENLGDALDLNDQQDYIFKMLEENKEELKKEING